MTAITGAGRQLTRGNLSLAGQLHFAIDGGIFAVPEIVQPYNKSVHFHDAGGVGHLANGSAGLWTAQASLNIALELINSAGFESSMPAIARLHLIDPTGGIHATAHARVPPVSATKSITISSVMTIKRAELWSIPRPFIYTVVARLEQYDRADPSTRTVLLDSVNTTVGLRTAGFKESDGLHINGQRVRLKGFCNHNDFAAGALTTPYAFASRIGNV